VRLPILLAAAELQTNSFGTHCLLLHLMLECFCLVCSCCTGNANCDVHACRLAASRGIMLVSHA
jgi:hypothetical protein